MKKTKKDTTDEPKVTDKELFEDCDAIAKRDFLIYVPSYKDGKLSVYEKEIFEGEPIGKIKKIVLVNLKTEGII